VIVETLSVVYFRILSRVLRLYETGIGFTTGFIGSQLHNSVTAYTLQLTTTQSLLFL
jgi:hypothetical protein